MKLRFVGDEVSAAGFRLAGFEVRVPPRGGEGEAVEEALLEADLLVITAQVLKALPRERAEGLLAATTPLVLAVPDVKGRYPPEDLGARLRRMLGMEG